MKSGNLDGAPSGEGDDPNAAKSEGELKLVNTILGYNSFRILLRLYFHRVVIDMVQLVVGSIYLATVHPSKDMRPVYLVVRGALGLLSVPIGIASDAQGPDVSMKLITLKIAGAALYLLRFGWLIYGTILCSHVIPHYEGSCDKPCFWTVCGSVIVDWTWAVLTTCAALCPFCWALTDQWSTYLFMIYVAIRKGRSAKSRSQVKVT